MKKISLILSLIFITILFTNSALASALIQTSFSANPTTVAPGSDGYLQLTLKNVGTTAATNIKVNGASYGQYVTVATSGIGNLGSLGSSESTTALFKISVSSLAPSGLYDIRFSIDYCVDSTCTEINPTGIVTVQAPSALQVTSVEPNTLAAGQTTTLNFNLANTGVDAVNNIVLSWQTSNNEILPLGISNRQFISSLNGGTFVVVPVNVSVEPSVTPGIYPLTIQLSYFDKSGVKQNVTSLIGIKIGGTTDFDVAVQDYSAGTLSLSIANIGVNPATSVSVAIPQQNNFAVSGAASVFLGNLNSGDFSVATFQISSRFVRNATGPATNINETSNVLKLQISYSDTSGVRQSVQKEVSLNLAASQITGNIQRNTGFNFTTILLIVIIVVVAVVLLWYFKLRKKKNFLSQFIGKIFRKV